MTVNRLLNPQVHHSQQLNLIESMIIEAIQAKGVDVKYIMRDMVERDSLFGEAVKSKFVDYGEVEVYIEDIANHDGSSDMFSKFGMEFTDGATFKVASKRFKEEFVELFGIDRPREGDLIYLPVSDSLFEIKKVLMDENFRQLGVNYTYRLKCNLFQYSHEELPATEDMESFADLTSIISDGGNAMLESLGVSRKQFADESVVIKDEASSDVFDPTNPFKDDQ